MKARLSWAKLAGADFTDADVSGADMSDAELTNAALAGIKGAESASGLESETARSTRPHGIETARRNPLPLFLFADRPQPTIRWVIAAVTETRSSGVWLRRVARANTYNLNY